MDQKPVKGWEFTGTDGVFRLKDPQRTHQQSVPAPGK